jgi:exodeoxyribonuclease VII small subunit
MNDSLFGDDIISGKVESKIENKIKSDKNDGEKLKSKKKPTEEFDFSEYTFELAMKELENIIFKLERGELSLEDGLNEYKKGIALKEFCQKKLNEAKETMEKIYQESQEN